MFALQAGFPSWDADQKQQPGGRLCVAAEATLLRRTCQLQVLGRAMDM